MVYWSSIVVVLTSYHKLSGLKHHEFLFHISLSQKPSDLDWFLCSWFHESKVRLWPLLEALGLNPLPSSFSYWLNSVSHGYKTGYQQVRVSQVSLTLGISLAFPSISFSSSAFKSSWYYIGPTRTVQNTLSILRTTD